MSEYFDADGNPVEVFTPEEVETKLSEAKADNEEKIAEAKETVKEEMQASIEALKKQIEDKEEEMQKLASKDMNFGSLRKIKEDLEKKLVEKEEEFNVKLEEIKSVGIKEKIESTATILAAGDKELKDKIVFHYNSFQGAPKDGEEFKTRMSNAHLLATGSKPADISNLFPTSGGFVPKPLIDASGKGELSEAGKEVGRKMGITDEDVKKVKEQGLI